MREFWSNLSIKNKLISSFAFVLALQAIQSYLAVDSLSRMNNQIDKIVTETQPAATGALEASESILNAGRELGFYLITHENEDKKAYRRAASRAHKQVERLTTLPAVTADPESATLAQKIAAKLKRIEQQEQKLLEVATDPNRNMPAMAYAAEHVNPEYRRRLQLLSSMLQAEEEEEPGAERKQLYAKLVDLRYYWTSINNELRLFLAFRADSAVDNLRNLREVTLAKIKEIETQKDLLNFEQADAFEQFTDELDQFWSHLDKTVEMHLAPTWRSDAYLLRTQVSPAMASIHTDLTALKKRQETLNLTATEETTALYQTQRVEHIASLAVMAALILLIAWLLSRNIGRPLQRAVDIARRITGGDLDNRIETTGNDETGRLLRSLMAMQDGLRERIEADQELAAVNLRIRQALDNVSAPVTVSNADNQLIYMNSAAAQMFRDMAPALKPSHPDYDPEHLIGGSIGKLFDDRQVQADYARKLVRDTDYDVGMAGRKLRLSASPVYDDDGEYQGRVTQWLDRTEELALAEQEAKRIASEREEAAENYRIRVALDNVASSVVLADTDKRIIYLNHAAQALFRHNRDRLRRNNPDFDVDQPQGTRIDSLLKGLNKLNEARTDSTELHIGDTTLKVTGTPVENDKGERLGTALELEDRTIEVAVEKEIDTLVEAARAGDLGKRIDTASKTGFFRQLGEGFNALLDELSHVFEDIATAMSHLAEGDLTHKSGKTYSGTFGKVQQDIDKTMHNLSDVLQQLQTSAEAIGDTSEEISAGNNSLSMRTEQQAANLEETASSMEELTSTVQHNADNAQQANQVAASARLSAEKGGKVVNNAIAAMQAIDKSSSRIAEIIGVIDEIAFQTNLLALNASVEAARAGEQGRGFAVVATEVRNLASRSADAAKEIKELIQDSVEKVNTGSSLVNESGERLEELVDGVRKVGDIIAEIAAASAEQSEGIAQVNNAVTSIDELTQQNAALAEQTSAASAGLLDKAGEMRNLVGFFRLDATQTGGIKAKPVGNASPTASTATASTPPPRASKPESKPKAAPRPKARAKTTPPAAVSSGNDDEWEEF